MSLYFENEDYEASTPTEIDELLADLPFELIKESIKEQIQDPMSTHINYIDIIVDKCNMFKEQYQNNEEVISEIDSHLRDFFVFIMEEINDKFDLGLDIDDIATYTNASEVGACIYRYFILRYMKNITKFVTKFIFNNKKSLSSYYADKPKKDVSTLAYKKQLKNPDDLSIITNLPSIMKYIIGLDIDSIEFIELSTGPDNYDAIIVKQLIKSGKLLGDFYGAYMRMCVDSHDYIIDELQTEIRLKIINKMSN